MAQSYTWNTSNPADRFNGPVTWTDRSNDYQVNQFYLYAEKTTNTNGCGIGLRLARRHDVRYRLPLQHRRRSGNAHAVPVAQDQHRAVLRHRVYPVLCRSGDQRLEDQGWSLVCPGRLRSRADNRQLLPQPALYLPIRRTVHHDRRHRHEASQRKRVVSAPVSTTAGTTSTTRTRTGAGSVPTPRSSPTALRWPWPTPPVRNRTRTT